MKKIAITGSKGMIGSVLKKGLDNYKITPLDLPKSDVRDYENLLKVFHGHDSVIHLAWDTKTENFKSGKINPDNALMVYNVYKAAIETKIPRVIMASSVHAENFYKWKGKGLMSPDKTYYEPDSPYGASKIFMEALGRHYATKGLEAVCIRFGGVNSENKPPENDFYESAVWLSHNDCVRLVRRCIEVKTIANNFFIVYGVSDNKNRIHDYSNPIGWVPNDNTKAFMS